MEDRIPLDPSIFGRDQRCFGCAPDNHVGMQLSFERDGDEVCTTFVAREGWEGPPEILHGGLQATLADEIGAWTVVGLRGRFGLTTSLQLRYYRPARMALPIDARGRIVEETDQMIVVGVTLRQDGKRVLSGRVSYAIPTEATAEKILGGPLPDAWKKLTRTG